MITEKELNEIVDAPVPAFGSVSDIKRAQLLRLCADTLDRAGLETVEALTVAHQLASWADQLERSVGRDTICECGQVRRHCICDKIAGEQYLETDNPSGLVAQGWPRMVLQALKSGDVSPTDLLSSDVRTDYQKGATPSDIRHQSM